MINFANKKIRDIIYSRQLVVIVVFLLSSCSEKVSTLLVDSNAQFGAQIAISTNIDNGKASQVQVRLFDEDDKVIATNDIGLYINNTPLYLVGGTRQRYYHTPSKYSYYSDSIPLSKHYNIYLVTIDSVRQEIASFTPILKKDIKYDVIETANEYYYNWHFYHQVKSLQLNIRKGTYHTVKGYKDSVINKKIKPTGKYIMAKSFLKNDSILKTTFLSVDISIKKEGMLNSNLLPTSSIIGSTGFGFDTDGIKTMK